MIFFFDYGLNQNHFIIKDQNYVGFGHYGL
jgi:hypothetical protein